jgi:hypothetical protein
MFSVPYGGIVRIHRAALRDARNLEISAFAFCLD